MPLTASPIGRETPRVDGPLKVTGKAQYTSDFHFPGMLYAVPVEATIANGRVAKLDTTAVEKMPGVFTKAVLLTRKTPFVLFNVAVKEPSPLRSSVAILPCVVCTAPV